MDYLALVAAIVVVVVVGRLLFRLIFDDAEDFWDCVRFSLTPDLFSLFRGELFQDMMQSFKHGAFVLLVGAAGVGTYWGVASLVSG